MELTAAALALLLDPPVLAAMAGAAALGVLVGALPGLTATLGVALLVPFAVRLDPLPALAAVVTLAAVAIAAGDLPGALLRMPGTPASAAYTEAAHRLARRGRAGLALGAGLVCAALGGVIGALVLLFGAPVAAALALHVSTVERFWLTALGLSAAVAVAGPAPARGTLALLTGLAVALVGLDPVSGQPRLTFGQPALSGGVGLIPVLIGLFAVARVLRHALLGDADPAAGRAATAAHPRPGPAPDPPAPGGLGRALGRRWGMIVGGSAIGTAVGALPGAGADIAAYVAQAVTRRRRPSRPPPRPAAAAEEDDAALDAIVPAGAANNAAVGGALVPAVVLGIPGDSLTAVVIGVLMLKGLTPGPTVFLMQPETMTALGLAFLLANLLLVPAGLLAIAAARPLLRLPATVLMPLVLGVSMTGAWAVEGTATAIWVTLAAGAAGLALESARIPLAPVVLGLVLGPMLEAAALTSLMKSGGDPAVFVQRPAALGLALATALVWGLALARGWAVARVARA